MEGAKETSRIGTQLGHLEEDVYRFSGTLDKFLSRIRIDEGLRLVSDSKRIESVPPADITLTPVRPGADFAFRSGVVYVGSDVESDEEEDVAEPTSEPMGEPMEFSDDQEDAGPSGVPTPVELSTTSPSDTAGDHRMMSPPPPPLPSSQPPPPAIQLVPATPQTSQEAGANLDVAARAGSGMDMAPAPLRSRPRSRTPMGLMPPMTRSRSRSKTPL